MEKLIDPRDYTLKTLGCIEQVKHRMDCTNVAFTDQDIKVFEYNGETYILSNPRLGCEPIYDDLGRIIRIVPLHNITMMQDRDWIKTSWIEDKWIVDVKIPKLRIMRPELCVKITKDGEIIEGF